MCDAWQLVWGLCGTILGTLWVHERKLDSQMQGFDNSVFLTIHTTPMSGSGTEARVLLCQGLHAEQLTSPLRCD